MASVIQVETFNGLADEVSVWSIDVGVSWCLEELTTWTGTIKLQRRPLYDQDGARWAGSTAYVDVATYTAETIDGTSDVTTNPMPGLWEWRLVVTAYTGGTMRASLGGSGTG